MRRARAANGADALSFEQFARWWQRAQASPAPSTAAEQPGAAQAAEPPGSTA
jgi:hypothetical protein